MKLLIVGVMLLVGFGGLVYVATIRDNNTDKSNSNSSSVVSIQTIASDLTAGGQLIDVRTPVEYASGYIDGATNLPLQDIQAGTFPAAAKDKPVYVYCRSGNRSNQAVTALQAAGYQKVIDLGGMTYVQSIGGVVKS